jgi:hypothetical protein
MTQPTEYAQVGNNNTEGNQFGAAAADKIGFYGATPVVQRATATTHTTTNVVTSAPFGTLQVAKIQEIQNTLAGLGLWAS